MIAVSAGLGAVAGLLSWVSRTPSPIFWNLIGLAYVLDMALWTIGCCLLFKEVQKRDDKDVA
jgi:hypothetical protein